MKIERIPEYLTVTVAMLVGVVFAVYCGSQTGSGQFKTLGILISAVAVVLLCLFARARIWWIIPLCWPLSGKLEFLPMPFTVRDLAILLVFGAFLIFYALKLVRAKPSSDFISLCVIANLLYLVTVYIRNPVGTKAFGSEMVGGYPYVAIAIAFLAYLVLSRAPTDRGLIRTIPLAMLLGSSVNGVITLIDVALPSLAFHLSKVYSGFAAVAPEIQFQREGSDEEENRFFGFADLGRIAIRALCSFFPPISILNPLYFWRFLGGTVSLAAILLSGFRTGILSAAAYFVLGTLFRRRARDLIPVGAMTAILLGLLIIGNGRVFSLPFAAQRALSFLPGNWDVRATSDASASAEWRFEMWKMVLSESKWIRNKWLGDGFGFTKYELSIMEDANDPRGTGFIGGVQQEAFLIVGTYHNGPLSTIRYAGVVGLILFYTFMISLAVRAAQLVRLTQRTNLFPMALFIGFPVIYLPFEFTFIVGGFDGALCECLLAAGYLKLLERCLEVQESPETSQGPDSEEFATLPDLRPLTPVREGLRPRPLPQPRFR